MILHSPFGIKSCMVAVPLAVLGLIIGSCFDKGSKAKLNARWDASMARAAKGN
jgi:hypothetical protein